MDGHAILSQRHKMYMKPWDGFIPEKELSKENLPPFYVRLQDIQVGPLHKWASANKKEFPAVRLQHCWPHDFLQNGVISSTRHCWGVAYAVGGSSSKDRYDSLIGGEHPPSYTDPGLPLTYTSCGKIMLEEPIAPSGNSSKKREATEKLGEDADHANKKAYLGIHFSKTVKEGLENVCQGALSRDVVLQTLAAKIDALDAEKAKMEERMRQFELQKRVDTERIAAQIDKTSEVEMQLEETKQSERTKFKMAMRSQRERRVAATKTIKVCDEAIAGLEKECEGLKGTKARLEREHIAKLEEDRKELEDTKARLKEANQGIKDVEEQMAQMRNHLSALHHSHELLGLAISKCDSISASQKDVGMKSGDADGLEAL